MIIFFILYRLEIFLQPASVPVFEHPIFTFRIPGTLGNTCRHIRNMFYFSHVFISGRPSIVQLFCVCTTSLLIYCRFLVRIHVDVKPLPRTTPTGLFPLCHVIRAARADFAFACAASQEIVLGVLEPYHVTVLYRARVLPVVDDEPFPPTTPTGQFPLVLVIRAAPARIAVACVAAEELIIVVLDPDHVAVVDFAAVPAVVDGEALSPANAAGCNP